MKFSCAFLVLPLLLIDEERAGEKPTVVVEEVYGAIDVSRYGWHASLIVFKIKIDACILFGHCLIVNVFISPSILVDALFDKQLTNISICISDSTADVILLSEWNFWYLQFIHHIVLFIGFFFVVVTTNGVSCLSLSAIICFMY